MKIWNGLPCELLVVLAVLFFYPFSLTAQPNDALALVVRPDIRFEYAPSRTEVGSWQLIRFEFSLQNEPLPWQLGYVSSEAGTVTPGFVITDENGKAQFLAKSEIATNDTFLVQMLVGSATHTTEFYLPDEDSDPYLGRFPMQTVSREFVLKIEQDRIGIMTSGSVDPADVSDWARQLSLTVLEQRGENLYTLGTNGTFSQNSRWDLVRRLKQEHPVDIVAAGLVSRPGKSGNPVILDNTLFVRFRPEITNARQRLKQLPVESISETAYGANEFHVTLKMLPDVDPLKIAGQLAEDPDVIYAHPEIAQLFLPRNSTCSDPWCNPRYPFQWHLENADGNGTLEDADIDARKAWNFTMGSPATRIAVMDFSFFIQHWDLAPNLLGNNAVMDLADNNITDLLWSGNHRDLEYRHGTNAAGVAAARGDQGEVAGVCPFCSLQLVRVAEVFTTESFLSAFKAVVDPVSPPALSATGSPATTQAADVISFSMGWELTPARLDLKEYVANASNVVMVFAAPNEEVDSCGDGDEVPPDSSSIESVIGVGGLNDRDRLVTIQDSARGFGACLDVMAPTGEPPYGEQISTASVRLSATTNQPTEQEEFNEFSGTSAATPQVAGTAALVLDANMHVSPQIPLSPQQVQMILQDTTDKVQPLKAAYDAETGFSAPENAPSKHAYGRINAFEAVRLAAPAIKGGKENRDIFLRDHPWDWGNTEQPSDTLFEARKASDGTWKRKRIRNFQSSDIRIDANASPSGAQSDISDSFTGMNETPQPGTLNRTWVRIRNRGQQSVPSATLTLYWTIHDKLPARQLPATICPPAANNDAPCWHPLPPEVLQDLPYSGASVAGCPNRTVDNCPRDSSGAPMTDAAQFKSFDIPPSVSWDEKKQSLALLALADSAAFDPLSSTLPTGTGPPAEGALVDYVTSDNNVTLWMEPENNPDDDSKDCWKWGLGGAAVLLLLLLL
jgi:subtilisin family serine protease